MADDTHIDDAPVNQGADDDAGLPPSWAESRRLVPRAFVQPILGFMRAEAAGGVVMLVAAVVAVAWANSPLAGAYFGFFDATIEITFGDFAFHHLSELTVREWINDALMVLFFFVVGLEIKRELVVGDLRDPRAAALPVIGALGGVVLPAVIYLAFTAGTTASGGWGIPMATDIAFAVGVLAMIGRSVPIGAKLFLLALAIVDDLIAIMVIALFYTDELAAAWLGAAALGLVAVVLMRRAGYRSLTPYLAVGAFVWLAVLESGVHATVAGVALALLAPVESFYSPRRFAPRARGIVDRITAYLPASDRIHAADHHTIERAQFLMGNLQRLTRESLPPLYRLESGLVGWTSFVIIPIFALANAGVVITGEALGGLSGDPVVLGVAVGLVVGKTAGISLFAFVAVKLGLARLPARTTWSHMIGVAMIAGIGFTVALFVASLSFDPGSALLDSAKIGIFAASIVAGVVGFVWLRVVTPQPEELDANRDGVLDARQTGG